MILFGWIVAKPVDALLALEDLRLGATKFGMKKMKKYINLTEKFVLRAVGQWRVSVLDAKEIRGA